MAMEDMISQLYQYNMGLPLQYTNPYFSFLNNQAGNMTSLGNQYQGNMGALGGQAMGLYGNLAGQQASMYQSELPMQMEMAKYNSLAPALSGLLGQFGGGGMNISPISMSFDRPDVMRGYQGAVDGAYSKATDAYGRAHGDTTQIGNQFQGQWQNLQNRAFPKQQGGPQSAQRPAGMDPTAQPWQAPGASGGGGYQGPFHTLGGQPQQMPSVSGRSGRAGYQQRPNS